MRQLTSWLAVLLLLLAFFSPWSQTVNAQISPGFTALGPTAGCSPLVVIFDDTSSVPAGVATREWRFSGGLGSIYSTDPASMSFVAAGSYDVTLILTDMAGNIDSVTYTGYVTVNDIPDIDYSIIPSSGCQPLTVTFNNLSDPGCGVFSTCQVDVGDGTIYSSCGSFTHTYAIPGTYDVTVYMENSCGCDTIVTYVGAVDVDPRPSVSYTSSLATSCTAPLCVTFNGSAMGSGGPYTYFWDFDSDGVTDASGPNPTECFTAGVYDVMLIAENSFGCRDTFQQTDYVNVASQTAYFTYDTGTACSGVSICFQDSSYGNTPVVWTWKFRNGGLTEFAGGPNPCHTFTTPGVYDVTLVVGFTGGCIDSITYPAAVTILPGPTADFTASDTLGCDIGPIINLTDASSGAISWQYTIEPGITDLSPNPSFSVTGNTGYDIELIVWDADGCSDTISRPNYVKQVPIWAEPTANHYLGCVDLEVDFTANILNSIIDTSTGLLIANTIDSACSLSWDFGDGTTSSLMAPTHTYTDTGCYDVTVTVTTCSGCVQSFTANNLVCVGDTPTIGYAFTPDTICFEEVPIDFVAIGAPLDSIIWDFGDGQFGSGPMVSHDYADIGPYGPCVRSYFNGCPSEDVCTDTLMVMAPVSVFRDSTDCSDPYTHFFIDESILADSIWWDFGDPSTTLDTSSDINPSWTYPSVGTYTVTQYVWNDSTNCFHQSTQTIIIEYPDADFSGDTLICGPASIVYTNTSDYTTLNEWFFSGPAYIAGISPPSAATAVRRWFSVPGLYTVTLVNYDVNGCTDTLVREDYIQVEVSTADFYADTTIGCYPLTINFFSQSSSSTEIVSYEWDFNGDGIIDDTVANPSAFYPSPGLFTVCLTIEDSVGCRYTECKPTYITPLVSIANFLRTDTFVCTNQPVNILPLASGFNITYEWSFPGAIPPTDTSTAIIPPPPVYPTEGVYPQTLYVRDEIGCDSLITKNVHVFDPVADFSATPRTGVCPPLLVNFSDSSINNVCGWKWYFGDGDSSFLRNPSHLYTEPGVYTVTMVAVSCTGCEDSVQFTNYINILGPSGELTASPLDVCLGDPVQLFLSSVNTANAIVLSDDGGFEFVNPSPVGTPGMPAFDTVLYVYDNALGNFTPQVQLDDGMGCVRLLTSDDVVTVDSMTSTFTFVQPTSCDTATVCFNGTASNTISSTPVTQFYWDFGDGDTSTQQNPCHFFATPGAFTITLIATNHLGCTDTTRRRIVIPGNHITNFIALDSVGCVPSTVMFTDATIVDTTLISWSWDFDHMVAGASIPNPTYTYTDTGTYFVLLVTVDTFGCTDSIIKPISVNSIPLADAGPDTTICHTDALSLNGSGGVQYVWSPATGLSDTTIANPLATPAVTTTYYLTVTDINGCINTDSVTITVNRVFANFETDTVCFRDTAYFNDLSTAIGGTIVDWSWDFDEPSSPYNTSLLQHPDHYYMAAGDYNVLLTTTDDNGCSHDTTLTAQVRPSPTANFSNTVTCFGDSTSFTDLSIDGGTPLANWHWDFGNGDTSILQNPTYYYTVADTYMVTLTVGATNDCGHDTTMQVIVFEKPIANFVADTACLGDSMQFTDLTVAGDGMLTNWHWDFGVLTSTDDTSIIQNPAYYYNTTGLYNSTLSVVDEFGCADDTTMPVWVTTLPQAYFTGDTICESDTVNFMDLSVAGDGILSAWHWDFGTPSMADTSDLQSPWYAFNNYGTYTVSLMVTDEFGCTDDTTAIVEVGLTPTAAFAADTACFGDSTQFMDLSVANTGSLTGRHWDFGTGDTSLMPSPAYYYNSPGTYPVTLSVGNTQGCMHDTTINVQVNVLPIANFEADTACFGTATNFTDLSVNGDGLIDSYTWHFGNPADDSSMVANPSFTYASDGIYSVNLEVSDNFGCEHDTTINAWVVTLPIANFDGDSVCQFNAASFSDLSTAGSGVINAWHWDFGTPSTADTSIIQNPNYTYNLDGLFTVTFSVFDEYGCTDDTTGVVQVSPGPMAAFSADTACFGDSTYFTEYSVANLGTISSWHWDFGDGDTSILQTPTHYYSATGTYPVTLTVVNSQGCPHDTTINVQVNVLPVANFEADTACFGAATNFTDLSVNGDGLIDSYTWHFGNATDDSSMLASPSFIYASDGVYSVNLEVSDNFGCTHDTTMDVWVLSLPVANFNGDSICQFETANFSDISTAGSAVINAWHWDFGTPSTTDTSILQNPGYAYNQDGLFTVTFNVFDEYGCTDDTTGVVQVSPGPTAAFSADTACLGDSTQFTDLSLANLGTISDWHWDFGGGDTSTLQSPAYLFAGPGTYPVSLTVTNSQGCTHDTTVNVQVNVLPTANFMADTVCFGATTSFTDQSVNGDGLIDTYLWHFANPADDSAMVMNPTFTYAADGTYPVNLQVTDNFGCTHDTTINVQVNTLPIADFDRSAACVGVAVNFTDMSTSGTEPINSWVWGFDDIPAAGDVIPNPTHTFVTGFIHNVQLIVTDSRGCADTANQVVIINQPPLAEFGPATLEGCDGTPFDMYSLSTPGPSGAPVNQYAWDVTSDGSTDYTDSLITHIYPTPGLYDVELTVTDTNGCVSVVTHQVEVFTRPTANFDWDRVCEDEPMPFTDLSTLGDAPITSWDWDFGDGFGDAIANPSHIYPVEGSYTVSLDITDANGCESSATQVVQVDYVPSVVAHPDTVICIGDPVIMQASGNYSSLEWEPALDGIVNPSLDSQFVYTGVTTTYTVTASNGACPDATSDVTVVVTPLVGLELEADPENILMGMSSELTAFPEGGIDSIRWSPIDDLDCWDCMTPTASPLITTTYQADIYYNYFGANCTNNDTVTVYVSSQCDESLVFVPNTFTPNDDGLNDVFYLRGIGMENIDVFRVFDRWGKLLFEVDDVEPNDAGFAWDGTNKSGKKLNPGVYVYVIQATCSNGDAMEIKGNVTLIR